MRKKRKSRKQHPKLKEEMLLVVAKNKRKKEKRTKRTKNKNQYPAHIPISHINHVLNGHAIVANCGLTVVVLKLLDAIRFT